MSSIPLPSRADIHAAYMAGEPAIIELIERLCATIQLLESRIQRLEEQIGKNSHNSSKPPSSDGYQKPKPHNSRTPSGKSSGGQKGHNGHTLSQVETPDEVITHPITACPNCQTSLTNVPLMGIKKRQVFDTPKVTVVVTEHQAEIKQCPTCNTTCVAAFPSGVTQPAQYGSQIKSQLVYLNQYHLIPVERTQEIIADLYGHTVGEGTIIAAGESAASILTPVTQEIKHYLTHQSTVNHFDETGIRVGGALTWLHSVSTKFLTYYHIHAKRGTDAMDAIGILPLFRGIGIHDHWKAYFKYLTLFHALCNAHHLRELKGIVDTYCQPWAHHLTSLLIEIKDAVVKAKSTGRSSLTRTRLITFSRRYDRIVSQGMEMNQPDEPPVPPEGKKRRGRVKQSPAKNLLDRLIAYKSETLRFMYDFRVPFDNNQAERDIRMTKLKQKISGCFRSQKNAGVFCQIRGYISTVRKHDYPILDALDSVFKGTPYIPPTLTMPVGGG